MTSKPKRTPRHPAKIKGQYDIDVDDDGVGVTIRNASLGGQWQGLHVELRGTLTDSPPPRGFFLFDEVESGPDGIPWTGPAAAALSRAWCRVAPNVGVSASWRQGVRTSLRPFGDIGDLTEADWSLMWRGRKLLAGLAHDGRPPVDRSDFKQRVDRAWLRRYSTTGEAPSQEDIAEDLAYNPDYFRKLRRKHLGVSWSEYRPDRQ